MANWDEETLNNVINQKHGEAEKSKPKTAIVRENAGDSKCSCYFICCSIGIKRTCFSNLFITVLKQMLDSVSPDLLQVIKKLTKPYPCHKGKDNMFLMLHCQSSRFIFLGESDVPSLCGALYLEVFEIPKVFPPSPSSPNPFCPPFTHTHFPHHPPTVLWMWLY